MFMLSWFRYQTALLLRELILFYASFIAALSIFFCYQFIIILFVVTLQSCHTSIKRWHTHSRMTLLKFNYLIWRTRYLFSTLSPSRLIFAFIFIWPTLINGLFVRGVVNIWQTRHFSVCCLVNNNRRANQNNKDTLWFNLTI